MALSQPIANPLNLQRFPALAKLGLPRRKRIPVIQQLEAVECGAACLAMVLGYYGCHVRLETLRGALGVGSEGVKATALLRAAGQFGLRGRGLKVKVDDLVHLPRASILHWTFNHFVVFEQITRRGVVILDPAHGRRVIPIDRFRQSFTGVALAFEPTSSLASSEPRQSSLPRYIKQMSEQLTLVIRALVISVLLRLFALSLPVSTALLVDRIIPHSDESLLTIAGIGLSGVLLFQFLSNWMRSHLLLQLRTHLDTRMTLGFMDHLVSLPYGFFQRRSTGDLLMRVSSNANIRELLTSTFISSFIDGLLAVGYLGMIFALRPVMAVVALGLGALQVLVFSMTKQQYRRLMAEDLESQAKAQAYLTQILAGIETLKASGAEHRAVEHWSNLFVDELNVSIRRGSLNALIVSLKHLLQSGSPLLILSYGAMLVMNGEMGLGTMLAMNALAAGFLTPLSTLVDSALRLQVFRSYVERIDDIMMCEPEQHQRRATPAPKLSGGIELDHVSFQYSPQSPMALSDISLVVEAGSSVAIVGRSGSGKSTLASLLLGLYQPTEGCIRYDGHNLMDLDLGAVRRQMGIVPQKPYIFSGSIRHNLSLTDREATYDAIVAAARTARIHDDIAAMPMGYESLIADGGSTLSGGQNQRLALARALVHQPVILLLDEATSALDSQTESEVMNNLVALRCTRIMIAHRLSTIANADQIVVMDHGQIVAIGRHNELISRCHIYHELVAAQTLSTQEHAV